MTYKPGRNFIVIKLILIQTKHPWIEEVVSVFQFQYWSKIINLV